MIYHFYIELQESDPLVWRRITIPAEYSLYQLHMVIQGAIGWENCHLFQFSENGMGDKKCYAEKFPGEDEYDWIVIDARKTKMKKIFKKTGDRCCYIYDFGDEWQHEVKLEKIEDREFIPYCPGGSGACPPEDVGSMDGYNRMVEILKMPRHPEKKSYITWLGLEPGEKWDAGFCSVREVNKRLALLR